MASRPDNDIPSLVEEFADRVHFIHLRNVEKDADQVLSLSLSLSLSLCLPSTNML
jgi:D-mannonate dehydratase